MVKVASMIGNEAVKSAENSKTGFFKNNVTNCLRIKSDYFK